MKTILFKLVVVVARKANPAPNKQSQLDTE